MKWISEFVDTSPGGNPCAFTVYEDEKGEICVMGTGLFKLLQDARNTVPEGYVKPKENN